MIPFQVSHNAKNGVPFDLTVSFKNTLPHPLTKCSLDLDGVMEDDEVQLS